MNHSAIFNFEEELTSNEPIPERPRKYRFSKLAIELIPDAVRFKLREEMELDENDPASYMIPNLDNINNFVTVVNGNADLVASIPAELGGPAAAPLTAAGLMTSLVTDVVTRSGRGAAVIFGTLIAPNTTEQLMILVTSYYNHQINPWYQQVYAINQDCLPLAKHYIIADKALTPKAARISAVIAGVQNVFD